MVLLDRFGGELNPLPLIVAILSMGLWVFALCILWTRQIMAGTKTNVQDAEADRSLLNWMVTLDGYDWRLLLGLVVHLVALWLLRPSDTDPTGFTGVGIGGLYLMLLIVTRRPERGYSRW